MVPLQKAIKTNILFAKEPRQDRIRPGRIIFKYIISPAATGSNSGWSCFQESDLCGQPSACPVVICSHKSKVFAGRLFQPLVKRSAHALVFAGLAGTHIQAVTCPAWLPPLRCSRHLQRSAQPGHESGSAHCQNKRAGRLRYHCYSKVLLRKQGDFRAPLAVIFAADSVSFRGSDLFAKNRRTPPVSQQSSAPRGGWSLPPCTFFEGTLYCLYIPCCAGRVQGSALPVIASRAAVSIAIRLALPSAPGCLI